MEEKNAKALKTKKASVTQKSTGANSKANKQKEIKTILKNRKEPLVFGLDIGTRSIVGTVGYKENTNRFVVVAQVAVEHETRAMMDGQIHDIQAVADAIIKVKNKLESQIGITLKDVCIAAAGRVLKTVVAKAKVDFNYETVITSEHIYSLEMLGVENAYENLRQEKHSDNIKFYCVGYSVIRYYQNDYPILNLEGHKANTIETELIATFLPDEVVDGLYAAVEKAGLFVANLTLEPIAAINVAIPERFRLLNIALVDVGAGTSDISITNDGSILAYGMIPAAGDEVTECLARRYLTDFAMADKIKCQSTTKKQVSFKDIMGITQKISSDEVAEVISTTVEQITRQIADKIKELNGGKSVSAVFVVGGGGKVKGFVENLAQHLELPVDRVALRGSDVMGNIEFLQSDLKIDSLLVTPVGICLNYYEQKNNFIFVTVNGERIKLYDNSKLTAVDAAMQTGFPNEDLFPKRGKTLEYTINGEKRMKRGESGEAAIIKINGQISGLSDAIEANDKIEIIESTCGAAAELTVGKLPEYHTTMQFVFNGKKITCPRFVKVNGELVSEYYGIQANDKIEIVDYYTLQQVLEFMDITCRGKVYVNNAIADMNEKVYDNFSVACEIQKEEPNYQQLMDDYGEGQIPEAVLKGESFESREQLQEEAVNTKEEVSVHTSEKQMSELVQSVPSQEPEKNIVFDEGQQLNASQTESQQDITILVNGEYVVLKHKKEYILVDVLDFYEFDLSVARGNRLLTLINGKQSDFVDPVQAGDEIRIYWE